MFIISIKGSATIATLPIILNDLIFYYSLTLNSDTTISIGNPNSASIVVFAALISFQIIKT